MSLTKATFSVISGAPINVDDYIPAGTNTATTDCTAFIQAAIDAASADGGRGVVFSTKAYRINSTVQIKAHNTVLDGRNCELDYYGAGIAVDFIPVGGTTYPVTCSLSNIALRVRTSVTGTGFRIRASYSTFRNLSVVLYAAATSARGITLVGDETNGTGPYYNQFYNCGVQSQSNGLDHIGISFVAAAPAYRSPNANSFYGGRVGQCLQGIVIKGSGNAFYNPTIENAALAGTAIKFEADSPVNCIQNQVFGAYIENAATAFLFSANADYNSVYSPFATGVSTYSTDSGTGNLFVGTQDPAILPLGINPNGAASSDTDVLDAYQERDWTPVPTNLTVVGTPTYTGRYIKIGKQIFWTLKIESTTSTASTANSTYFSGLPNAATQAVCGAVNSNVVSYGNGYVETNGRVYSPTWSAVPVVFCSGVYEAAA